MMRNKLIAAAALTLGAIAMPAIALAENQPSEGENSTGRNEQGFGGGPHCHINVRAGGPFTVQAFPSHQGHDSSGLGAGPFVADPNCDGVPG
jgi:hypothetical protein